MAEKCSWSTDFYLQSTLPPPLFRATPESPKKKYLLCSKRHFQPNCTFILTSPRENIHNHPLMELYPTPWSKYGWITPSNIIKNPSFHVHLRVCTRRFWAAWPPPGTHKLYTSRALKMPGEGFLGAKMQKNASFALMRESKIQPPRRHVHLSGLRASLVQKMDKKLSRWMHSCSGANDNLPMHPPVGMILSPGERA